MLARIDRGDDKPDQMIAYAAADLLDYAPVARENLSKGAMSVTDMCKAMVELSDNTCANLLLARVGGPAALTEFWRKTGNNGKDASGDIAVVWPKPGMPVLIAAYTQGGTPAAPQIEAIFTEIGRMAGRRLG